MCDEPKVSDEQFSDKSPLEIAQDELDVMCKRKPHSSFHAETIRHNGKISHK